MREKIKSLISNNQHPKYNLHLPGIVSLGVVNASEGLNLQCFPTGIIKTPKY